MSNEEVKTSKREFPGDREVDGVPIVRTEGRDFRVEGNDVDGYVGVSSEYRTYSSPTDKPYTSDEDVELMERTGLLTDVEQMSVDNARRKGIVPESQKDEESDDEPGKSDDESGKSDDESGKGASADGDKSGDAKPATDADKASAVSQATQTRSPAKPKSDK